MCILNERLDLRLSVNERLDLRFAIFIGSGEILSIFSQVAKVAELFGFIWDLKTTLRKVAFLNLNMAFLSFYLLQFDKLIVLSAPPKSSQGFHKLFNYFPSISHRFSTVHGRWTVGPQNFNTTRHQKMSNYSCLINNA